MACNTGQDRTTGISITASSHSYVHAALKKVWERRPGDESIDIKNAVLTPAYVDSFAPSYY